MKNKTKEKNSFNDWIIIIQIRRKLRIAVYRRLISMLSYGKPLVATLEGVVIAYAKRDMLGKPGAFLVNKILENLKGKNSKNISMSGAIQPYVSKAEYMLLRAGDESGNLVKGLEETLVFNQNMGRIIKAVKSTLTYPLVLLIVLFGLYMLFAMQLLPSVEALLPRDQWPPMGQKVGTVLDFVRGYWPAVIVSCIAVVGLFAWVFPRWSSKSRRVADGMFPFNLYKSVSGATFLTSLSSMLSSGVAMQVCLDKIREDSNPYLESHIREIQNKLKKGEGPGESLDTGLFDQETSVDLEVFGSGAGFEKSFKQIADDSIENTITTVNAIGTSINVALVAGVGGSIVFLMGGFYSVIEAVKNSAGG